MGTAKPDELPAPGGAGEGKRSTIGERFSGAHLTVLAHFYRGEVQRSNIWRQKMDITTNWAIVSTTAAISVAFSTPDPRAHVIFPFASFLVLLLLHIEGRRYRFFDVWRTRVRMLECHLLVPTLFPELPIVEGNWRQVLADDLLIPSYKISYWEAVARRMQRNYAWIFVLLLVAWVFKVLLIEAEPVASWSAAYRAFGWGNVPPSVVLSVMGVFYAFLAGILLANVRVREATGEIRRKDRDQRHWPI